MNAQVQYDIQVRKSLDFAIDQVPRFWFDNNPFKTRVFDALTITFPEGERYFISSVRLFRDAITDPTLAAQVKDFIAQEAQHGMAHDRYNNYLIAQGQPIGKIMRFVLQRMKDDLKYKTPEQNIALTAAAEHITSLMAECFFSQRKTLEKVHPNMRAMLAWHAIEEMEHKAVAFDVMQKVAKVDHATRIKALMFIGTAMPTFTLIRANAMLKHDGFSRRERLKMFAQGLPWLLGKNGLLNNIRKPFLDGFRKDFHPNDHAVVHNYSTWLDTFAKTGSALEAGQAFWEAGH